MDKIALAPKKERKSIFIEAANRTGISNFIIEKDFWVSWVLERVFRDEDLSKILRFKGGTSLSKAFGLINRFSEDIDLILSMSVILEPDEILEQSSNTKQIEFNKAIEDRAKNYIGSTLFKDIRYYLANTCSIHHDKNDGHVLLVKYLHVFDYDYIQPEVRLEIGPLALWTPNEQYPISSFVEKALPELGIKKTIIPTIKPEQTFWEKITILHHEHHRPKTSPLPPRYSRHYYDVYMMGKSNVKTCALNNINLLEEIVNFKIRFYPRGWANYENAFPGTIRLLPAEHNSEILAKDYHEMQKMLFGDIPSWDVILSEIEILENEINFYKKNTFKN